MSRAPASPAPEPPWPMGNGNNPKRVGWSAFFAGRDRLKSPFPAARGDLAAAYAEGWDAAEALGRGAADTTGRSGLARDDDPIQNKINKSGPGENEFILSQPGVDRDPQPVLTAGSEPSGQWRPIGRFKGAAETRVTLWLDIHASPRSMGMGDAFAVADCWREGGKWVHIYRGKPTELEAGYVTHWAPANAVLTAGPRGADLDWWRG